MKRNGKACFKICVSLILMSVKFLYISRITYVKQWKIIGLRWWEQFNKSNVHLPF